MPTVIANELAFHVQELGAGAPAIVMLHGLLVGSLASWYFTSAPALARAHRVRLFDLRGHGKSARPPRGYDTATMAGDLDALTADLDRFDLVGHSWGALVALRFALDHPTRVRRLAIVEAPLPPARFAEQAGFFAATPDEMIDALPAPLKDAVAGGRRQAGKLLASLRALAFETSLLDDLRREPDLDDAALRTITAPTLLAYGDRSSCLPAGKRLAAAIPGARLAVLPGGHYLHLDAKVELTRALEEHLA